MARRRQEWGTAFKIGGLLAGTFAETLCIRSLKAQRGKVVNGQRPLPMVDNMAFS